MLEKTLSYASANIDSLAIIAIVVCVAVFVFVKKKIRYFISSLCGIFATLRMLNLDVYVIDAVKNLF